MRENEIPPDQARFMVIYGVMPDRWSGDARETEPFVDWVEGGTPMREEGEQSSDGYHRESRAIASMFQMGVAEYLVGLSADQRRRMLEQVKRWSVHYDDEIQGWGLFYLWVLKEKGETLPAWHERWLADGLKNEYWATKVELGRKAIDKARALRKGTPLER
ncbi:MAG: hypothetical protein HRU70_06170 [Phycisphaeraceae bacterium]|nr:MAG: hypothetical protein HRU70_06170 [Phycisphaeraceae bacterium]